MSWSPTHSWSNVLLHIDSLFNIFPSVRNHHFAFWPCRVFMRTLLQSTFLSLPGCFSLAFLCLSFGEPFTHFVIICITVKSRAIISWSTHSFLFFLYNSDNISGGQLNVATPVPWALVSLTFIFAFISFHFFPFISAPQSSSHFADSLPSFSEIPFEALEWILLFCYCFSLWIIICLVFIIVGFFLFDILTLIQVLFLWFGFEFCLYCYYFIFSPLNNFSIFHFKAHLSHLFKNTFTAIPVSGSCQ